MTDTARQIRSALEQLADADRARPMAAYMRDRFPFFGIPTPQRRAALRPLLTSHPRQHALLLATAQALWGEAERECQYAAADLLIRHQRTLEPEDLPGLEALVVAKPWWDTVDALATRVIGPLVLRHRELVANMDRWIEDPDIWRVRVALLHQLQWKEATDAERLFAYCRRQAGHPDFFIRKGIGWALRQYARTDAAAVRAFILAEAARLSPLSLREAGKHLGACP